MTTALRLHGLHDAFARPASNAGAIASTIAVVSIEGAPAAGTWSPVRLMQTLAGRNLYRPIGEHLALWAGQRCSVTAVFAAAAGVWAPIAPLRLARSRH